MPAAAKRKTTTGTSAVRDRALSRSTAETPIVLDLPVPPSVNRTRRIDWRNFKGYEAWRKSADNCILAARCRRDDPIRGRRIEAGYELSLVLNRELRADPSNLLKATEDILVRAGLIVDDSPEFCRRIVIEYGEAPMGCRVTLRPLD